MPSGENLGGPGASAGSIKAGGAYVEIVGKDGTSKAFSQVQDKIVGLEKSMKRVAGFAGVGGFLGGLFGGTTLVSVLNELGQATADWVRGTKEIEAALAKSRKELEQIGEQLKANSDHAAKFRAAFSGPEFRGERMESLEVEIARLEKRRRELHAITQPGQQFMGKNFGEQMLLEANRRKQPMQDAAKAAEQLKELDKLIGQRIDEFNKEITPESDPAFLAAQARRYVEQLSREFFDPQRGIGGALKKAVNAAVPVLEKENRDMMREEMARKLSGQPHFGRFGLMLNELRGIGFDRDRLVKQSEREQLQNELDRQARGPGAGLGKFVMGGLSTMFSALDTTFERLFNKPEVRAGFGGQNAMQRFGFGENVAQLSLKAQQQIADQTKRENVAKAVADGLKDLVLR